MPAEGLRRLRLHPVEIPMVHRFRGIEVRHAVILEGDSGWGEFSPFAGYAPEVAVHWLRAALEAVGNDLPEPTADTVEVNVTVPVLLPGEAGRWVKASGASTAKVKIGGSETSFEEDLERVAAVRDALGAAGRIRVDVNGAWDVDLATDRIGQLAAYGLEYVEQPVATIVEMVELRRRVAVPIAADESVRSGEDPLEVVERGGADVVILKCQPMGGVASVIEIASRSTVPVVISSALETSVGLYPGLVAATLISNRASGLGTASLLTDDVVRKPLLPIAGRVPVRLEIPDHDLLEKHRPDPAVATAMIDRIYAAAELL